MSQPKKTSTLERLAYESLCHTWENDDDYYVCQERHGSQTRTGAGILTALLSGLVVTNMDEE